MYVCICIYIYIHIYIYIFIFIFVYLYIHVLLNIYIYIFLYMRIFFKKWISIDDHLELLIEFQLTRPRVTGSCTQSAQSLALRCHQGCRGGLAIEIPLEKETNRFPLMIIGHEVSDLREDIKPVGDGMFPLRFPWDIMNIDLCLTCVIKIMVMLNGEYGNGQALEYWKLTMVCCSEGTTSN